jgi:hypothetical protein
LKYQDHQEDNNRSNPLKDRLGSENGGAGHYQASHVYKTLSYLFTHGVLAPFSYIKLAQAWLQVRLTLDLLYEVTY